MLSVVEEEWRIWVTLKGRTFRHSVPGLEKVIQGLKIIENLVGGHDLTPMAFRDDKFLKKSRIRSIPGSYQTQEQLRKFNFPRVGKLTLL